MLQYAVFNIYFKTKIAIVNDIGSLGAIARRFRVFLREKHEMITIEMENAYFSYLHADLDRVLVQGCPAVVESGLYKYEEDGNFSYGTSVLLKAAW